MPKKRHAIETQPNTESKPLAPEPPSNPIRRLRNPSLLSISDLTPPEVALLFRAAEKFLDVHKRGGTLPLLAGKTIGLLFFENSTRTRLSFETAAKKLSAGTLVFSPAGSSVAKGESFLDTLKNIEALRPDLFVIRHAVSGSAPYIAARSRNPIVNGGDGMREHPTQALLDAFTLLRRLGDLVGRKILILGDIIHSRVARSNIRLLKLLGAQVILCGPGSLLPQEASWLGADELTTELDPWIPEVDAVITLRIQRERQNLSVIPSLEEYARFYGLDRGRAERMQPEALVLHPGPVNRGVEIAPEVADGPRSVILEQVENGVALRMAVLAALLNPAGLWKFLEEDTLELRGDSHR
jgi:aspartate carbamoyltransferase catalytic subunit